MRHRRTDSLRAQLWTAAISEDSRMRIPIFLLAAAVSGCAEGPTNADNRLVRYVEQNVVLPKGSPGFQCYKRYYRVVGGAELAEFAPSLAQSGHRLLIGRYIRPQPDDAPGMVWINSDKELPIKYDAGCGALWVYYVDGEPPETISATCSFDIAGQVPAGVEPFSC